MGAPDPISLLQSIIFFINYGIQLTAAAEEIESYYRTVDGTSRLARCMRMELAAVEPFLTTSQREQISQELQEVEVGLAKAQDLVVKIKKSNRHWSRSIGWVAKHKGAAQTYEKAISQSNLALSRIDLKLFWAGTARARSWNCSAPDVFQVPHSAQGAWPHISLSHPAMDYPLSTNKMFTSYHEESGLFARMRIKGQKSNQGIHEWLREQAGPGSRRERVWNPVPN